jgi:endogenous inhibitor of DNA gyrase (YacG/DUF329 family)
MANPVSACPICGRPANEAARPCCSRRCADVDLGRWLTEQYRVPGVADTENEDESGGYRQTAGGPAA